MKEILINLIQDIKTSMLVAGYTVGSGVAWGLNVIDGQLASIATVSGVILTWILIYYNIKKGNSDQRLSELHIRELQNRFK